MMDQRLDSRLVGRIPERSVRFEVDANTIGAYLCGFQIDKDVMVIMDRVCVGRRLAPTALEIFAAYKAAVDIEVHSRYRAYFLKVKIE